MSRIRGFALFAGLLALLQMAASAAWSQLPPACNPYRCHCISTSGAGQSGFGGGKGNIAIQIRAINPAVTSITVESCATGGAYFSGSPAVGQQIGVDSRMCTQAFAPGVGLSCAVHYWIIDYKGNPRR